jgi:hypothetical protein
MGVLINAGLLEEGADWFFVISYYFNGKCGVGN